MIEVSIRAQSYFRQLLVEQGEDAVGVLLRAIDGGTPAGEVKLEFCEAADLKGDEHRIDYPGACIYVDRSSLPHFDGAHIDYEPSATGGQLNIRAPRIKGEVPTGDAGLVERVRHVLDSMVNPQLAMHGGKAKLEQVTEEGVVLLRFGGGCHGCGMVEMTMRNGVEKTLMAKVPGVTGVRDVTDHSSGTKPYYAPR
ncbi:MAG: NfuA family Fe-S biogenesis protein [Xanthomonadales bacterium]|nr:NfuA family Fe-S biogenesis protein [Xanthomonadales bacterium]